MDTNETLTPAFEVISASARKGQGHFKCYSQKVAYFGYSQCYNTLYVLAKSDAIEKKLLSELLE